MLPSPDPEIRKGALHAINQVISVMPNALVVNMEGFLRVRLARCLRLTRLPVR
jgi:hypothetical protein